VSRATSTYPSAEQCSLRVPYFAGHDPVRLQPYELVSAGHVPRTEQHHSITDTSTSVMMQSHLDFTATKTRSATTAANGNLMWLAHASTCQTTGCDESDHTDELKPLNLSHRSSPKKKKPSEKKREANKATRNSCRLRKSSWIVDTSCDGNSNRQ
jgi:hypothetical protein